MPEVINQQRKIKIDIAPYQTFTEKALKAASKAEGISVTIAFVSDRKIRELNKLFRGKNKVTDVLSFPFESDDYDSVANENFLGDIVISLEQAARQATKNDLSTELEIKQLILHGILHLCGYDHETDNGEMNKLELKLRDKLRIKGKL